MTMASTIGRARSVIAAAAVAAVMATSGCGEEASALEGLTPVQQDQLTAAWIARINVTDGTAIPDGERTARATALYAACKPLDPTDAFLAAVASTCGPTAVREKLAVVLPTRCAKPAAICVRALDRIAEATDGLAVSVAKVGKEASRVIEDPVCRKQFTVSEIGVKAYGDLAAAYRIVALGVEQKDEDISTLGQRRIDDALATVVPKGTAAQRVAAFRSDCGLSEG